MRKRTLSFLNSKNNLECALKHCQGPESDLMLVKIRKTCRTEAISCIIILVKLYVFQLVN